MIPQCSSPTLEATVSSASALEVLVLLTHVIALAMHVVRAQAATPESMQAMVHLDAVAQEAQAALTCQRTATP